MTIIAASGDDCDYTLPGVSSCRRDVLDPYVIDRGYIFLWLAFIPERIVNGGRGPGEAGIVAGGLFTRLSPEQGR